MGLALIYHRGTRAPSPFDACAVELSRNAELRIACPYLSLGYLCRLVALTTSWRLITDIEEWLSTIMRKERKAVCDFVIENSDCIRHVANLHAKVLIGTSKAMVGSANLTNSGIQCRTEMAICIDERELLVELSEWFDNTWRSGHVVSATTLRSLAKSLPLPNPVREHTIFSGAQQYIAPLVSLDEDRDIRRYNGARGYYIGRRFCVIKGSIAVADEYVVKAFRKTNNGLYDSIRDSLIRSGVLAPSKEWEGYEFTEDFIFASASAAACVVSGQSRSGPKEWGRP